MRRPSIAAITPTTATPSTLGKKGQVPMAGKPYLFPPWHCSNPVGFGAARLVKRQGRIKFCPHITAPPLPHAPRHPDAGHEVGSSPAAQPFSSPLTPTHRNLPHYYFALHEGWCIFACIGMQVGQRCQSNIQYCEVAQPPFQAIAHTFPLCYCKHSHIIATLQSLTYYFTPCAP